MHIREIGLNTPSSLSLRGTILVHKTRSWAGRSSVFIPIECVSISRSSRFDAKSLVRGIQVLSVAIGAIALTAIPITLMPREWVVAAAFVVVPLVGALAFGGSVYFLYMFALFLRRRPTVRIDAEVNDGHVRIECWDQPGRLPELDALIDKVQALQKRVDELVPYPVEISFHLFHMKPFRMSILQAALITLILFFPVRWFAGYTDALWMYFFLALPWMYYLGGHVFERLQLMTEPKLFREAVDDYEGERLHEASLKLRSVLNADPDHLPALVLQAQTSTLQGDFPAAFATCDRIDDMDDELGEALRDEILSIERLHKRMDEKVN